VEVQEPKKSCSKCTKLLSISDFYQIWAKDESQPRWEKICKVCKQIKRNQITEPVKQIHERPDRRIEPKSNHHLADILHRHDIKFSESAKSDFKIWESAYGRSLNDDEKIEIQSNLLALLFTLAEERYRQSGEYIELSKDK
jgi:hypothetical protein